MFRKRFFGGCVLVFLIVILAAPAAAQWIPLGKFKGVEIPCTLKYKDKVLEKGKYDIEAVKHPNTPQCYLRFKKNGDEICTVEGEWLTLPVRGGARRIDPSIPNTPRLKMKKDTEEKVLIIMLETGRRNPRPYLLIRFKMEYEE
jgi:hypothetical protein